MNVALNISEFVFLTIAAFTAVIVWKRSSKITAILFAVLTILQFVIKGLELTRYFYFTEYDICLLIAAVLKVISAVLFLVCIILVSKTAR